MVVGTTKENIQRSKIMIIIKQYILESLGEDREKMQEDRIGPMRDQLIAMEKKYPDAYKRARSLYDLWVDSPQYHKANDEVKKRWPNVEYNGGDGTESAINIFWNSMEDHPDIKAEELRELKEFIRMMIGDGIT